ncbi:hypothetical protein FA13DRAFT_1742865 [Coprinellus micaceus]|uniref:Uncharacterized protein n=1 Tax=Coprinellus micaceus TaxID=71717 RepID=A0A4Y7SF70_COPMI|nr:hypothetical protein FA13DRAFT_1742865 [Coprinellus micaceus]
MYAPPLVPLCSLCMLVITSLNMILLYSRIRWRNEWMWSPSEDRQEVLPGLFGEASLVLNHSAMSVSDNVQWVKETAGGYVRLGEKHTPFGVSFYHHLHCWNRIRLDYLLHSRAPGRWNETRLQHIREPQMIRGPGQNIEDHIDHDDHCFQYMALALLCRADFTMLPFSDEASTADAAESQLHRCRDWTQVRDNEPYTDVKIVT